MYQPHTIRLSTWARLLGLALLLGVGVLTSLLGGPFFLRQNPVAQARRAFGGTMNQPFHQAIVRALFPSPGTPGEGEMRRGGRE